MRKSLKFIPNKSGQSSKKKKFKDASPVTRHSSLFPTAFLWDESFLWGLMAHNSLKSLGLSFDLVRSADIKKGCLKNYKMLFVPGGWASNKSKALGKRGVKAIRDFVDAGGNYLGLCGGAGLATSDGIGLLNVIRKPTKDRIPSFSGRICLNVVKHRIWHGLKNSEFRIQNSEKNSKLQAPNSGLVFHAYWPSQFLIKGNNINVLATFGDALPDAYSSDLNVGDINKTGNWSEPEKSYGINLNPARLMNEPAVIEARFGKGRVVLSLVHFDTPGDENGQKVLRNLWEYLAEDSYEPACPVGRLRVMSYELRNRRNLEQNLPAACNLKLIEELETEVTDLIAFGERNFLWFWRNPMLLQWRRGVRGLEYCTLFVMIKQVAQRIKNEGRWLKDEKSLIRIKKLLFPFIEKSKQLLILERHVLQNGQLSPLSGGCSDPEIQKIRTELFSDMKSHGGKFKKLIDGIDNLLFFLLRGTENL